MNWQPTYEIPPLEPDGLPTSPVRDWAEDKHRLVSLYAHLFMTSMRGKWDRLVYLDLFAGAGRSHIKGTERLLPGSPMLALGVKPPFHLCVFCEQDATLLEALKERVGRDFPGRQVEFVLGDVNANVPSVLGTLPVPSRTRTVLAFCFVDPFKLRNLHFSTIRQLSERKMDFLVLIPTGYDATRNERLYMEPEQPHIDDFLGNRLWREDWAIQKSRGVSFDVFITDAFGAAMEELDYIYPGVGETQLIRMTGTNAPLYRLALFSQSKLGTKFWREVRKYAPDQKSLF